MAMKFPSLNLGMEVTGLNQDNFGIGNGGLNVGYGAGGGSLLTAPMGGGSTSTAATPNAGLLGSLGSLFSEDGLFSRNSLFGGLDDKGAASGGWVSPLAGLAQAGFGAFQGNKQLSMAQDRFDESKRQFDANYAAQRQSTNTQLEDRQRARVASNPTAYQPVSEYLDKNRIK